MTKREMTIEEAIEIFKEVREEVIAKETELSKQVFENLGIKAIELAIKVLEQQPCEDCISRAETLRHSHIEYDDDGEGHRVVYVEDIEELPSVTPKQKVGKWIEKDIDYYKAVNEYGGGVNEDTPYFVDDIACPKCLKLFSVIDNETERFNYCPNCGADMKGGKC